MTDVTMTLTRPQARPPSRSVSLASGLDRAAEEQRFDFSGSMRQSGVKIRQRPTGRNQRRRPQPFTCRTFSLLLVTVIVIFAAAHVALPALSTLSKRVSFLWTLSHGKARPRLFALITDLDRRACRDAKGEYQQTSCSDADVWVSYFKRAILPPIPGPKDAQLTWVDKVRLESRTHFGSRGMELSELQAFSGHLVAPDDRTGILYEIVAPKGRLPQFAQNALYGEGSSIRPSIFQRAVLYDGPGIDKKLFFKGEWAVEKDGKLIVGGHGRAITDPTNVSHENWSDKYAAIEKAVEVAFPGYLMHEAVLWSSIRREWVFLPRRFSREPFDSVSNEKKGWNHVIFASEHFDRIRPVPIPELFDPDGFLGFSSAKFLPGSDDKIVVALRTVEIDAGNHGRASRHTQTVLSAFNIFSGEVLLKEQRVGYKKEHTCKIGKARVDFKESTDALLESLNLPNYLTCRMNLTVNDIVSREGDV